MAIDVVIAGGGVAGLGLARQLHLARPGLRLAVVDPRPLPGDPAELRVGESTSEVAAWYLETRLQLEPLLRADHLPKLGLRFFLGAGAMEQRREWGVLTPLPGYLELPFRGLSPCTWQLHRGRLEARLAELCGAELHGGRRVVSVASGSPHQVTLDGGEVLRARWVVDASGVGLGAPFVQRALDHRVRAAWFWADTEVDVDAFTADPTFHARTPVDLRWRSTNHLCGERYWVWVIRLARGPTSIGIVADPDAHGPLPDLDAAVAWLARHEPELAEAIRGATLGGYRHVERTSRVTSSIASPGRLAVTGEAAAFLDPMYSPGLDLTALANEWIAAAILEDLDGHDVARRCRRQDVFFRRIASQYLPMYRSLYPVLGNPRVASAKIAWDLGVYFGFLVMLVRTGRLADLDFLARVQPMSERVARLHVGMQPIFEAWAASAPVRGGGVVDQGSVDWVIATVHAMRPVRAPHDFLSQLGRHLELVEQAALATFRQAASDCGVAVPEAPLNPYALGLDPARWEADGLTRGRVRASEPAFTRGAMSAWT